MKAPTCPVCHMTALTTKTQFGNRHECCGLHSWDGKELVSQAVHDARQAFHAVFDPLWNSAERNYNIEEEPGSEAHGRAVNKIRRAARKRAYLYLSVLTELPEKECHGSTQTDVLKLRKLTIVAKSCAGPEEIRTWFKAHVPGPVLA